MTAMFAVTRSEPGHSIRARSHIAGPVRTAVAAMLLTGNHEKEDQVLMIFVCAPIIVQGPSDLPCNVKPAYLSMSQSILKGWLGSDS